MFKILTLNNIRVGGLERLARDKYEVASEMSSPDAILLRSANMHEYVIPKSLKAVGRAGAGVNNIPVAKLSAMGIPVFNTPGANANAVKELVVAGMLLSARNLGSAFEFTRKLEGSDKEIDEIVEAQKKNFVGIELAGRTLGVIGLGAIGVRVANAALAMGMKVIGHDPHITVTNAWALQAEVKNMPSVSEVLASCDFATFHVPLSDETRHLLDARRLAKSRPGITILNFSRAGIVDEKALSEAILAGRVRAYVCDFPSNLLTNHERVITLPHLGASTEEAEENCAVMAVEQIRDFLEQGTIRNTVNFPDMALPRSAGHRLLVANSNIPHMIERISAAVSKENLNIVDMLNRSRGEVACTLVDVERPVPQSVIDEISQISGVLSARILS